MTDEEYKTALDFVEASLTSNNLAGLLASVAESLLRLVSAQEELVQVAKADVESQIQQIAEHKAHEIAQEMDEQKSRRGFIGKK